MPVWWQVRGYETLEEGDGFGAVEGYEGPGFEMGGAGGGNRAGNFERGV